MVGIFLLPTDVHIANDASLALARPGDVDLCAPHAVRAAKSLRL
jgi:hypothetical protein